MGAVKEEGIPSEYQEVEWIGHTAVKTAFVTSVAPYENVDLIVVDVEFTSKPSNGGAILVGASGPAFPCGITSNAASLIVPSQRGYVCSPETLITGATPRATYTFTALENAPITKRFALFGWINNSFVCGIRAYNAKMFNTNNQQIFDAVPCYRKADGVIGIYDLIGRAFFPVSGTWTKGSDVN